MKNIETTDKERLDWLCKEGTLNVKYLAGTWYTQAGYRKPLQKAASLREAIDKARHVNPSVKHK